MTAKLTAKPATLDSAAHKNLANTLRRRNLKKSRIALTTTSHDPEAAKALRARAADDVASHKRRRGYRKEGGQRMDEGYLEGGDLGGE